MGRESGNTAKVIVGCHYNGTTSLYHYLKKKGHNIEYDSGLFSLRNGHKKFTSYYRGKTPVIILSTKKWDMWLENYDKWLYLKPEIYILEDIAKEPDFPHFKGARHGDQEIQKSV